jgi:hypothetical protein
MSAMLCVLSIFSTRPKSFLGRGEKTPGSYNIKDAKVCIRVTEWCVTAAWQLSPSVKTTRISTSSVSKYICQAHSHPCGEHIRYANKNIQQMFSLHTVHSGDAPLMGSSLTNGKTNGCYPANRIYRVFRPGLWAANEKHSNHAVVVAVVLYRERTTVNYNTAIFKPAVLILMDPTRLAAHSVQWGQV